MLNFLCRQAITGSRKQVFAPEVKGHRKRALSPRRKWPEGAAVETTSREWWMYVKCCWS